MGTLLLLGAGGAGGAGVPPFTGATFNGVNSSQVILSNGNLTATLNPSTNNVGARSASGKTTGKYYFEITAGPMHGAGCGMLTAAGTYLDMINNGTNCLMVSSGTGTIFTNGTSAGGVGSSYASGDVICFAIDLGVRHAWARKNGGNWNNSGTANPATDTGGVTLYATVGFSPAVGFGGGSQQTGDAFTGNFGATAFAQSVPSGFTAGWSA